MEKARKAVRGKKQAEGREASVDADDHEWRCIFCKVLNTNELPENCGMLWETMLRAADSVCGG